jgi:hypothetical protein
VGYDDVARQLLGKRSHQCSAVFASRQRLVSERAGRSTAARQVHGVAAVVSNPPLAGPHDVIIGLLLSTSEC